MQGGYPQTRVSKMISTSRFDQFCNPIYILELKNSENGQKTLLSIVLSREMTQVIPQSTVFSQISSDALVAYNGDLNEIIIAVDNQVHVGTRTVFSSPTRIIDMKFHKDSRIYLLLQEEFVCLSAKDYNLVKVFKINNLFREPESMDGN